MLYIHPLIQICATLLAFYPLYLGTQRFRSLHMGQKVGFRRKRHAWAGRVVIILWAAGLVGGVIMARISWGAFFITGDHAALGLAMIPFLVFGFASGWYLEKRPAPRKALPLVHGLNNLVLLILALVQVFEGAEVLNQFVKGG